MIQFNTATNGPAIDAANIDAVLALACYSWLDGADGTGEVAWSSMVHTNDTLKGRWAVLC